VNLAQDTGFRAAAGTYWEALKGSGSVTLTFAIAGGIRYAQIAATGVTAGSNYRLGGTPQRTVAVVAGDKVEVSCLYGGTSGLELLTRIYWYNAAGALVTATTVGAFQTISLAGGGDASTYHFNATIHTAPSGAAWATPHYYVRHTAGGTSQLRIAAPFIARARSDQTSTTPLQINNDFVPGADPTLTNTAAAIAGQGVFATGNYYEQSGDPGAVANGSFWFRTDTNEFYVRRTGSWGLVSTLVAAPTALSGATLSFYYVLGFTSGGVGFSQVVTASPVNGTGTITYQWVRTATSGAQRVTCSNTTIAAPTFSVAAGGTSFDTWTCTVAGNGRAYQVTVGFDVTLI
jgi:hypothetical protein